MLADIARSQLRVSNRQSPGNYAPQWAWRGSGATRANEMKLASFSPRSTAGSLRGLARAIWRRLGHCSTTWPR